VGRAALLGAIAAIAACVTPRWATVAVSQMRGPYIDATLALPSGDWRFFFPRTETCAAMLRPEAPITYSSGGSFGSLRSPDGSVCDPVGIGTLQRWRRTRRPGEMTPSSPAHWSVIYADSAFLMLRGRFPLASRLGVTNTFDVVAVVPNDEVCDAVARSGSANLVFRPSGSGVLDLGRCPVVGVALPQ
jgi:hypothetical protein